MKYEDVSRSGQFDLVSVGETMVAFVSQDDPYHYVAVAAGAESNVAIGMARLGCRTQWVSRVGADPLGRLIEASVADAGVAVDVIRDDQRPTGAMTISVDGPRRISMYYRSQSAARSLSPDDLVRAGPARWVHVTGITPSLSATAADLVEAVVESRFVRGARVSFDVNFRSVLWPGVEAAASTLLRLARSSDVVFIGDDEAQALFGTADAGTLSELILRRAGQELVVKRGAGRASIVTLEREVSEQALATTVLEPTGAGDAFAAGFLAATVFDWPDLARLRLGHLMASRVVGVLEHASPSLTSSELQAITPEGLARRWRGLSATPAR